MNLDQAKQYLARVVHWPQANEATAWINLHWTCKGRDGKPFWTGRASRSLPDTLKSLQWALGLSDTLDIYACLSTQAQSNEKQAANGWKYHTPIRNQSNAVALKSLFIDVDLKGGEHGYDTEQELFEALEQFLKATNLPKPTLTVSSGGGYHIYWVLMRALQPDEWRPLAYALAEATKRHGLKCDTQCTIDAARVLRVPDTFNRKQSTPRPVTLHGTPLDFDYTVERIATALEPYKGATPAHHNAVRPAATFIENPALLPAKTPVTSTNELSANIEEYKHAPISSRAVARECAFVRQAVVTGGKEYTNPKWMLTTLLATFMEDGRKVAHIMANQHPGYSKESTDELYDRKMRDREEKNLGWPRCETISGSGCKACQTCPHFKAAKSPLNFAVGSTLRPTTLVVTPSMQSGGNNPQSPTDLPTGYARLPSGVVVINVGQADGTTAQLELCDYPMTDPHLQKDPWTLHFTSVTDVGKATHISLPMEIIGGMEMRKHIQKQGISIPVGDKGATNIARFFLSWIKQLQATKNSVIAAPFGWNVDPTTKQLEGFVFGGEMWTPHGKRLAAAADPVIAAHYTPAGDKQKWIDAAKLITTQGRPALETILAAGFAAPLVRFTGHAGVLLSAYSVESGIGKSTALKIAQAIWGDPVRGIQQLDDTQNSVMGKLGQLRSLPLFWDELKTEEDTRKYVKITFQTSSGKEKSRMNRSAAQKEPGSWQTLLLSASNDSLLDHVMGHTQYTEAGLLRVLEFVVPPPDGSTPGQIDPSDASITVAALHDHYGLVGLEYARWLGANHATIEKEIREALKAWNAEVKAKVDERFWNAAIVCILMGAKYSNDLGFANLNLEALKAFMVSVLEKLRAIRRESPVGLNNDLNVSTQLASFLNAHRATNTIYTNRVHIAPGKPQPGTIKVLNQDLQRLQGVYVHVGLEDKLMRVSSTRLTEWLREKGLSRHAFMEACKREFLAKPVRGRIASGTIYAGATEYLMELNLAGTSLLDFIDEA